MPATDPHAMIAALSQPWHDAVNDLAKAQQEVLRRLLEGYAQQPNYIWLNTEHTIFLPLVSR